MSWKPLLAFPLAALICGKAVDPPKLKSPLPAIAKCIRATEAERKYLLAYAFRIDDTQKSVQLERELKEILDQCAVEDKIFSRYSFRQKSRSESL